MNTIDVRKLKKAIELLFDHIIDSGVERLDIEAQYYWQAEEHREYDFSATAGRVCGRRFS